MVGGRKFASESELGQANGSYTAPCVLQELANRTVLGTGQWDGMRLQRPGSRGDVRGSNPGTPMGGPGGSLARRLSGGSSPQQSAKLPEVHPVGRTLARRPMSFVKALEMSDSLEKGSAGTVGKQQRHADVGTTERRSVYDMNYEISV